MTGGVTARPTFSSYPYRQRCSDASFTLAEVLFHFDLFYVKKQLLFVNVCLKILLAIGLKSGLLQKELESE